MKNLHPGAKWLKRIEFYKILPLVSIIIPILFKEIITPKSITNQFTFLLSLILSLTLMGILIIEVYTRLEYKRYLYEISENEIKIEYGVIFKTYKSIPYVRIQNLKIKRGIIARMLGFSTLLIETAGYSAGYNRKRNRLPKSEGILPAIQEKQAEEIRKEIMRKIKSKDTNNQGI
jgi:uncharacterized membrane protein YdbT with pleckstrin-like domain